MTKVKIWSANIQNLQMTFESTLSALSWYREHIPGWEHLGAEQCEHPREECNEGFRLSLADQDWTECLLPVRRGDLTYDLQLFYPPTIRGIEAFSTFHSGMKVLTVVFFRLFGCSIFSYDWSKVSLTKPFWKAVHWSCNHFVSQKLVHGNCRVQYTVSPGMVTKGVSHLKDCSNRVYRYPPKSYQVPKSVTENNFYPSRHVDNFRGYR